MHCGQSHRLGKHAVLCWQYSELGASVRYLPRELLNDDLSHLDKADMFALGCTLYELGTNCQLPSGEDLKHITLVFLRCETCS